MVENPKRNSLSFLLEIAFLILMAISAVFVFSAGANVRSEFNLQQFYNFTTLKQLIFFPLAIAVMYTFAAINFNKYSFTDKSPFKSIAPYLVATSLILLVLVLIPGIGMERNFSRRWLALPLGPASISFQPSELAKWAVIIFLAAILDRCKDSVHKFARRFIPICIIPAIAILLIVSQDFGTAAFIALLTFLMLAIGNVKWLHLFSPLVLIGPVFYFAVATSAYRMARLKSFFDPENMSYHAQQSLIAISTGGIWGKGLGRGISKYGHLPEDTTDFIFAIIAEELGFVGGFFVIAVFIAIAILSMLVIKRCKSSFGRLLAGGIAMSITIQAAINIGVVTVVLPTKGIPLPFISAGGTSLLLTAAAAGILLNIARNPEDKTLQIQENILND